MSNPSLKKVFSGSFWGIVAKVFDALAKFVTIPMLIGYFGKGDYGLFVLAFSLNAYLRLMDMGLNIGSIRYFSIWLAEGNTEKITKVSQSSVVFYGTIGILNALIFAVMGHFAQELFHVSPDQAEIFTWMMYILSVSTVLNWTSYVVNQLLTAYDQLAWINQMTMVSSFFNFFTAFLAVQLHLSLPVYFLLYILSTLLPIPLNVFRLRVTKLGLGTLLFPNWNFPAFKEILSYSLSIFAMGLFQFTADNIRPILLASFASHGVEALSEYRVIQTICMLVISFGSTFLQVLLPFSSKSISQKDDKKIHFLVYSGTKYISAFLSFIIFLLIVNAKVILILYVGEDFADLSPWLTIWLLSVLIQMHTSPVASLILSMGKTKPMVWSSALSCLVSIAVTVSLAPSYGVGAAVVAYFLYIVIQISFSYFYYVPYILHFDAKKIFFSSFLPSALIGSTLAGVVHYFNLLYPFQSHYVTLFTNTSFYTIVFGIVILAVVVKPSELKNIRKQLSS